MHHLCPIRVVVFVVVLSTGLGCVAGERPQPPQPVAVLPLSNLVVPNDNEQLHPTLAFISEKSIALAVCRVPKNSVASACYLFALDWKGSQLTVIAHTTQLLSGSQIFRFGDGRILTATPISSGTLYSPDLQVQRLLPFTRPYISGTGNTSAAVSGDSRDTVWKVYRIFPELRELWSSRRTLHSVDDQFVVVQEGNLMRTETISGQLLGSFSVAPKEKCWTEVEIAHEDRLYLDTCGRSSIVDFKGEQITRLRPPPGWGYRAWSANRKRILFNHFTRWTPFWKRLGDLIPNDNAPANSERVQVENTEDGSVCFEWRDRGHMLDEGDRHADLSPSGEFVAIVTNTALSLYRIPNACKTK